MPLAVFASVAFSALGPRAWRDPSRCPYRPVDASPHWTCWGGQQGSGLLTRQNGGSPKGPRGELSPRALHVEKRIYSSRFVLPDPRKASFGARLRYLRRRLGLTIEEFSKTTGLSHNAISRIERDAHRVLEPWILGRIIPQLQGRLGEVFPETKGDPYDFLYPRDTFGGWIKNFRARRGLLQNEVAKAMGVSIETIRRYQENECRPSKRNLARLKAVFGLDGELDRYFK